MKKTMIKMAALILVLGTVLPSAYGESLSGEVKTQNEMASIPEDTQALLKKWDHLISEPSTTENMPNEELGLSSHDALREAIEITMKIEEIEADELAIYQPSMRLFSRTSSVFPDARFWFWEVILTPPEGQQLRPYFIEIEARTPFMIRYDMLSENGEVIKHMRQDFDGEIYEEHLDLPGAE